MLGVTDGAVRSRPSSPGACTYRDECAEQLGDGEKRKSTRAAAVLPARGARCETLEMLAETYRL